MCASFLSPAERRRIAVRCDHDDRQVGQHFPHARQQFKATHSGHIDVGEKQDQRPFLGFPDPIDRLPARGSKIHHEPPGAHLTTELLTEQHLHIGFVINHEDEQVHAAAPADMRGRLIVNSAYSPTRLSTAMLPPCCFTMMSWLSERPRPVPSPAGLVVKNGSNRRARALSGIPAPLSRTRTSTSLGWALVATVSAGLKLAPAASCALRVAA